MLGKKHDIPAALAQGRQRQDNDTDPVIEILTEASAADLVSKIRIRRRDDRNIDLLGLSPAQSAHRTILDRLQDFGLGPLRQQSDLVEEERAATGGLKESELGLPRVSECTLLVAE